MGLLKHIAKGWWTYLFMSLPPEAKKKAKICDTCDSKVIGTYEDILPDYSIKEVQGYKCGECNCPLSTLLRSNKKCELGKF